MRDQCYQVTVYSMKELATASEQEHLDTSYAILDSKTTEAHELLRQMTSSHTTHIQNRLENEALASNAIRRLVAYEAANRKLCFGVVFQDQGESYHIGRIGLADKDQKIIQVDWRAPAAAAFYQATTISPCGLYRRRRITTEGRTITAIYDEVLSGDLTGDEVLSTDAVLLAALGRDRTGKMGDIVETIQHEQDTIVRSEHKGVLVVEGGPGTGKTVVALHRAAYLLYRDRINLERKGVLIIGPTTRFLNYINDVLPGLGETGVILATIGDLVPGVNVTIRDHPEIALVKSDLRLADVINRAIEQLRRFPSEGVTIPCGGDQIKISQRFLTEVSKRALANDTRHNVARPAFIRNVVDNVIDQLAQRRGFDIRDTYERAEIFDEINQDLLSRSAINRLWMPINSQRLVYRLWSDPQRLKRASDRILTDNEQELLFRSGKGWSINDIPILDEADSLLGPEGDLPRVESADTIELDYKELNFVDQSYDNDLSSQALLDRDWVYGHCIIDEAQELTPMQWRMISRRVPSSSMTVVGDLSQASTPGACSSWSQALDHFAFGKWVSHRLSVNYRTPSSIAEVAERYLNPDETVKTKSVRDNGITPSLISAQGLIDLTDLNFIALLKSIVSSQGLSAIISPRSYISQLRTVMAVDVLDVAQAKGIEFDNIVVIDPLAIEVESGKSGLYVALTRATRSLVVLANGKLPSHLTLEDITNTIVPFKT